MKAVLDDCVKTKIHLGNPVMNETQGCALVESHSVKCHEIWRVDTSFCCFIDHRIDSVLGGLIFWNFKHGWRWKITHWNFLDYWWINFVEQMTWFNSKMSSHQHRNSKTLFYAESDNGVYITFCLNSKSCFLTYVSIKDVIVSQLPSICLFACPCFCE